MDPVTVAIVAAVTAGAAKSAGQVAEQVLVDAYEGLKALLRRKFGDQSRVVRAVGDLEEEPESDAYKAVLKEQVGKTGAAEDPDVRKAAEALLAQVQQRPGGGQIVQQVLHSTNVAQSAAGAATATYTGAPTGQPGQPKP
jgi:hypothetical protein